MRRSSRIPSLHCLYNRTRWAILPVCLATCLATLANCSLLGSLNARKLLANCQYNIESIEVEVAKFRSAIWIGHGNNKTKVRVSDGSDFILEHWKDIQEGRFNLDFRKLHLLVNLRIENPNDQYVVIDSLIIDAFMGSEDPFTRIIHDQRVEVPAKKTGQTQFRVKIPIEEGLLNLMDQDKIKFKGTVWAKLKLTDERQATMPLPINFERKFPREALAKVIEKQKADALKDFYKKIRNATGVKTKDLKEIQHKGSKVFHDIFR